MRLVSCRRVATARRLRILDSEHGRDSNGSGKSSERRRVSTNPDEDIVYLEKPDTAFLTKARITEWEAGKTFSSDWAAAHFFAWAELLHPLQGKPLRFSRSAHGKAARRCSS